MNVLSRRLFHGILNLGSGEALARLCSIAVLLILARRFGVVAVGVYALAQGMVQYSYPFIDFGLRHVGARLIAQHPEASQEIVQQVQKRRILMGSLILPFLLCYASLVNLPLDSKIFVFLFSAIGCLYALSLEWAAWGKEHLRMVGFTRALVPGGVLLFLLLGWKSNHIFWWIILGNAVGYGILVATFRHWWRRHKPRIEEQILLVAIRENLAWRRTSCHGRGLVLQSGVRQHRHAHAGCHVESTASGTLQRCLSRDESGFVYLLFDDQCSISATRQAKQAPASQDVATTYSTVGCRARSRDCRTGYARAAPFDVDLVWPRIPAGDFVVNAACLVDSVGLPDLLPVQRVHCVGHGKEDSDLYRGWRREQHHPEPLHDTVGVATAAAVNTLISYVIFLASLAIAGRSAKELMIEPEQLPELIA